MSTRLFLLLLALSLLTLSPALALEPLPLDNVVIDYLDVPVDGVHGTTAIVGMNVLQRTLVSVPNAFTAQTFIVSPSRLLTPIACPGAETSTNGQALNRRGDVAGFCSPTGVIQGFLFRAGNRRNPFTLLVPEGSTESQALGLNDAQHVVGTFRDDNGFLHGFIQRGGTLTVVNAPDASDTVLTAINNHGRFVGYGFVAGFPQGFIGTMTETGVTLEPFSIPGVFLSLLFDINDAEDLVGFLALEDGTPTGFARLQGTVYSVQVPVPHQIFTDVTGISPQGHIVGRILIDDVFNEEQPVVSQGFILTPPTGGFVPAALTANAAVTRQRHQARKGASKQLQVTVEGCEDLAAGWVRPAKLGPCR